MTKKKKERKTGRRRRTHVWYVHAFGKPFKGIIIIFYGNLASAHPAVQSV